MKYIALFLIFGFIISCNNDEEDSTSLIGEDFIESNTRVYFIDTLTVNASTFMYDSLVVTNVNRLLIGAYQDETFGKTRSRSYTQLENIIYDLDDNAVFDSIALILNFDKYFYNDTIPTQQFKVYKVLEDIEPSDDDDLYYNTTNFNYNTQPIGEKYFLPKPNKTDSLEIRLNDDYGANIFNRIKDNDINNNSDFVDQIKGILIEANEDISTSILGFSNDSFIRLYYSIGDEVAKEETIDFTFNPANTFNQIESDKTGTFFEDLIDQETFLPSSNTNNNCFMQSGIGLVTRIDIPYIKSLNDISGEGVVVDAKLKFSLKRNSFSNNLATHDSIQAFIIDRKAEALSDLTSNLGEITISTIINNDPEFETDIYVLDIKSFIQLKEIETNEPYYLALYPKEFNSSLDRYIFNGDQFENELRMKLELTYVIYD